MEVFRIGVARIFAAPNITDPFEDWVELGPTRGDVVVTIEADDVALGRTDQAGATPLADAVWHTGRKVTCRFPLVESSIEQLALVWPGAVKVTADSKTALAMGCGTAVQMPLAWAVVPADEFDGGPWWDSEYVVWLPRAIVRVLGPLVHRLPDGDDALADSVLTVELASLADRALVGPVRDAGGIGPLQRLGPSKGVGVLGIRVLAEPEDGVMFKVGGPASFARASGAYQFGPGSGGYLWRAVSADTLRNSQYVLRNGVWRRATLLEPAATNQAPESCYFPASGSGWSGVGGFTVVSGANSAIEAQTAYAHTVGANYASRSRIIGTLGATRNWFAVMVENMDCTETFHAINEEGQGWVCAAAINWQTMTLVPEPLNRGTDTVYLMIDYGTGPNGGRLVYLFGSGIPVNPSGTRRAVPFMVNTGQVGKTFIAHYAGLFVSANFPGISPIVTTSSAVSRALDHLYTDSIPITSADTWTLYVSLTNHMAPAAGTDYHVHLLELADAGEPQERVAVTFLNTTGLVSLLLTYGGVGASRSGTTLSAGDQFECAIANDPANGKVYSTFVRNGVAFGPYETAMPTPSPKPWRLTIGGARSGNQNLMAAASYHTVSIARGVRTLEEMRRL